MKCYRCGVEGQGSQRFCAQCGASFNLDEFAETTIRRQVDVALTDRFKDQQFVTNNIAEAVANKVLGWTKIYAGLAGSLLTLCGFLFVGFGIKNSYDVKAAAAAATNKIDQTFTETVRSITTQAAAADARLKSSTDQISQLESKLNEIRQLDQSVSKYQRAADDVHTKLFALQGTLKETQLTAQQAQQAANQAQQQAQQGAQQAVQAAAGANQAQQGVAHVQQEQADLVSRLATVEAIVCEIDSAVRARLNALGYLAPDASQPAATEALKKFQNDHHLAPDGCAGPATRLSLEAK